MLSSACAESFTRLSPSFAGLSLDVPNGWMVARGTCTGWPSWSKDKQNGPDLNIEDANLIDHTAEEYCAVVETDFQKNGKSITKNYLPDLNGLKRLELTCVRPVQRQNSSEDCRVCCLIHWKPAMPVIVTVSFYFSAARAKEDEQIWNRIKASEEYSLNVPRSPIFIKSNSPYLPGDDFTIRVRQKVVAGNTGSPPIPISQPLPEYPNEMRKIHDVGTVTVGFVVGKDGATSDIHFLEEPAEKSFGDAVLTAIKHWTFIPSTTAIGEPVPQKMEYLISFDISGAD